MAIPQWPSTLPQSPLIEGFSDTPQDSVLRSNMDGYSKQRNRFTATIGNVEESYLLTPTQYATLKVFFHTTLGNGATDFIKNNPETGFDEVYRFSSTYSPKYDGVFYKVKLNMERLP